MATCENWSQGSGFLLDDDLVVTAAHVVTGGQVLRVINGTVSTAADIVGIDPQKDVALLRAQVPLAGRHLELAGKDPAVGDEVAAVGYTRGDPLSYKPGAVNGLDRKAVIGEYARHGLVELDFAANHGNSGGPVIDDRGRVVGIVDAQTDIVGPDGNKSGEEQGDRLAVPQSQVATTIAPWRDSSASVALQDCSTIVDAQGQALPADQFPTDISQQVVQTLWIYFDAINHGDFPAALSQLAHPQSLASFERGVGSTRDGDLRLNDITVVDGRPVVWLDFTSTQDPGDGPAARPQETCTEWSLDYHFTLVRGLWLIDKGTAHPGTAMNRPCS
ncbi:hypothetical protein GCM10027517_29990 [Phycicoccus ginsengisoli]